MWSDRRVVRWLMGLIGLLTLLVLVLIGHLIGGPARMFGSTAPVVLIWEGAAGRQPVRFVPVRVAKVTRDEGGLLGVGRSPSLPGGFPDARRVDVEALDGARVRMALRVPGSYLPHGLAAGQRIVLGLTVDGRVIQFLVPDAQIPTDRLADWAARSGGGPQ